jgi:cell division septation protein DedD
LKNKDYREIQLSSAQLAIIFLAILILGVVIFLLGVSVGKKQAQLAEESDVIVSGEIQKVEAKKAIPSQESEDTISKELASHQKIKEKAEKKKPVPPPQNLYYVQVAALDSKDPAVSFANQFKQRGYPAIVLDPFPTDIRPVFRVRIGGYETREEAEKILDQLQAESRRKVDYFVIRS